MSFISKILGISKQDKAEPCPGSAAPDPAAAAQPAADLKVRIDEVAAQPCVAGTDFMKLFMSIPEVFFPIHFIASRISKAAFIVRRYSDDSVVWGRNKMLKVLERPNCLMSWSEMVYMHFVYKLCTGNAFIRAAVSEAFKKKYKMCDHFWPLPADKVKVVAPSRKVPLFGVCDMSDLVAGYTVEALDLSRIVMPEHQVYHDRDGKPEFDSGTYLRSKSRLLSVRKPISNLLAVYTARNVIYGKQGGLGFLVNMKSDAAGTSAMTPKEKDALLEEVRKYGLGDGQSPFGITDIPLAFIRTNLSISELQPFEETLYDAIEIAGAYGIPAVLVPRKDQSTFSNQASAEKSVYSGVIIPEAKDFCNDMTRFLGLDEDGYYLDADFSDVDCLQQGLKESEEVKKLVNERCLMQFSNGVITLNDWRAQMHESRIEDDDLFGKLKFQMSEEELARVDRIIGNPNNKPKSSTGDEQRQTGNEEEPGVQDPGQ